MGDEVPMRCNGCGTVVEPRTQCVVSTCFHMFCINCAQNLIEGDEPCPICQSVLSKSNMKLVSLLMPSSHCRLMLCGQAPQTITDAALSGINFYVEQSRLAAAFVANKLEGKVAKMERQCRARLEEMQRAYVNAKQKCVGLAQQKNALEQDNQELQQKYTQKAMQTRKLQEMFKALQQENEDLKRRLGLRAAVGGGGGSGSGRHPSPFGGQGGHTQMVTTVRQTKAVIDYPALSPTPGSGGLQFLTGHGSAVVGSGPSGQRPGTAGAFGGGGGGGSLFGSGASPGLAAPLRAQRRPGTSGGMFGALGGGGGGGRMVPGNGGGGGGAMRPGVPRGIAGLGSPGHGMMSL